MSKKNWEPELPLRQDPVPRDCTSDRLSPRDLERVIVCDLMKRHQTLYQKAHGYTPATYTNKWFHGRITQLINHLCAEFFKDHDKKWRRLAAYNDPECYRDLVEQRTRIACDWIDWVAANHFHRLGLSDIKSVYWMSRYCEYLAKERLKALGTGNWEAPKETKDDITESWK